MPITRIGSEVRIHSVTDNEQFYPSVAGLADGGWVVTWTSRRWDSGDEIYQQRFDRDGHPVYQSERMVNITTANYQDESRVTALADGGWVVTWQSPGQDESGEGIYQQRFDRSGNPTSTADRLVNVTTTGDQTLSNVTALADGGWVVTWQSAGQDGDGSGIYQQRFDRNGNPAFTADRIVNVTVAGNQTSTSVTALADGGWIVAWQSAGQDGSGEGIYQQRYDSSGNAAYQADRLVNATVTGNQSKPSVTALADGGWVVTWQSAGQDGNGSGIYQQRFDRSGNAAFQADRLVNATVDDDQIFPSVAALADGWVVTWVQRTATGTYKVYQQVYDGNGAAASSVDLLVSTSEYVEKVSVTSLADGSWVVTWDTWNGSDLDIHQQRFAPDRAPQDLMLSATIVQEAAAAGTVVGTLSATDEDPGSLVYQLLDNADGRFKLVGNQILVADGFRLDYEQVASHTVKVQVKDRTGATSEQSFVIGVTDINPEIIAGTAGNDLFKGGAGNDRLSGNAGNDRLFGQGGADILRGEAGHDVLSGGEGRDKLYGGKGAASKDAFVFDTKLSSKSAANQHKDTIYDFGSRLDAIWFDDAAFTNKTIATYLKNKGASLDKPVKMKSSYFRKGDKALDKDDFFIWNDKSKKLYFDVDGSGRAAMMEIATIKLQKGEGTTLTWKDFFFV